MSITYHTAKNGLKPVRRIDTELLEHVLDPAGNKSPQCSGRLSLCGLAYQLVARLLLSNIYFTI